MGISVSTNITLHLITHRAKMKFIPIHLLPYVFKAFLTKYSLYHKQLLFINYWVKTGLSKFPTLYFIGMLVYKRGPKVSGQLAYTWRSILEIRDANLSLICCNSSSWIFLLYRYHFYGISHSVKIDFIF